MSDFDTVMTRIEFDLSQAKRELAQFERDGKRVAGSVARSFAEVGKALDLSRFRQELSQTERAIKQSAERMKQTFAEVGKAQGQAIQKALQNLRQPPGGSASVKPANSGGAPGESSSASRPNQQNSFSIPAATKGTLFAATLVGLATLPVTGTALLFIVGAGIGSGVLTPQLGKIFSGSGGAPTTRRQSIEEIEKRIEELEEPVKGPPQFHKSRSSKRGKELVQARRELARAIEEAANDFKNEFASVLENSFGSANTEFLDKFTRLSDCLQRLCDRLDELGLQGTGGSADLTGGAGNDVLASGVGRDGRLIPASFGNTGLGELNRNLAESAWRVQDLSTGFQEAGDAAEDYGSETRTLNGLLGEGNKIFTEQTGLIGALRQQLPELGVDFAKVFDETTEQGRELNSVIDELGASLFDAFSEGVFKGKELSGVLKELAEDILRILKNAAQSGGLGGGSPLDSLFGFLGIGGDGGGGGTFVSGTLGP